MLLNKNSRTAETKRNVRTDAKSQKRFRSFMPLIFAGLALISAVAFSISVVESRRARPEVARSNNEEASKQKTQPVAPNPKKSSVSVAPLTPFTPTITATKNDALAPDADGDSKADPGETIKYTVSVGASGENATGVNFTDTVDPNTTFVAGSLAASPVATNDTFPVTVAGNVRINSANLTTPFSVVTNDFLGVNPTATIASFDATTAQGGQISMTMSGPDIGKFTYNPPAGFEGTDTFTYTLSDNVNVASAASNRTATVSILVSGMIWFIDNNVVSSGDGRLLSPFKTLADFQLVNDGGGSPAGRHPDNNDNIFVYESATNYVGPVTLRLGQRFIGQDATATISSISGITPPVGSDPLPPANPTGAIVNITSNGITVGSGNTLRGFTGGNSTSDINGSNFGTLTVSEVTLNGTGNALNLATGTLNATFASISSASSATTGISLTSVGGSLATGSTTVTSSTGTGISLLTNTSTINFGALAITPSANQRGLLATDNSGNITIASGSVATTGAVAVEITRGTGVTPLTVSLTSVSANGGTNGIVLTNTNGSFTVTGGADTSVGGNSSGGTIQNVTGHAIAMINVVNPSFTNINIQNAGRSGVDGTGGVTNFTLANSTINNVGTAAAGQHDESNVSFNDNGTFTTTTLSGAVSITQNTLTNARRHGIQIETGSGTISNLTITNNTLTSSTNAAVSLGTAILVAPQGSGGTTAHLTTGNISNNTITNFPSAEGIAVLGGSGNVGNNTSSTLGANGTPINITNNTIAGQAAAASHLGSNAIRASMNSQVGVMNVNISCNGRSTGGCTATGPITNIQGQGISVFVGGTITGTTTINNNAIIANQTLGAGTQGLAIQIDDGPAGLGTSAANYNATITNNSVTNYEGNGIRAIARASLGFLDLTINNNNVGIPILGNRNAIRVDSGSAVGDVGVCMVMTGNTADGSGVNAGIGIRKQGTVATTNDFGIVGLSPSPATAAQAQAKVQTDNPASVGGVDVLSGDNFVSCSQTAAPITSSLNNRNKVEPEQPSKDVQFAALNSASAEEQPTTHTAAPKLTTSTRSDAQALSSFGGLQKSKLANGPALRNSAKDKWLTSQQFNPMRDNRARAVTAVKTPLAPLSGETVTHTIGTLQAGKTVHIQFQVTVNNPYSGGATVSNQGTVSGSNFSNVLTDDPAAGGANDPTTTPILLTPNVSVADAKVAEPTSGSTNMVFTVALSVPASGTVTVDFTTAPGGVNPATAGTDYTTTSGTVTFTSGQQVQTINVPVLSDADNSETDETFLVNLSSPSGAVIVDGQATGTIAVANPAGTFVISELRTNGPGGQGDDFVEVYNNSNSPLTIAASDSSAGYGLFKMGADCNATPVLIGTIPNGTVIPARGHYLFVGSAYSLANYGGTGAAAGNLTLSADIATDANVAIFSTSDLTKISSINRLDAVGFGLNTGGLCDLLREGSTLPANGAVNLEGSHQRDQCGKLANPSIFGGCPSGFLPKDTNDNAQDFFWADTAGTSTPAGQHLGAPGPENLASPIVRNATIIGLMLDATKAASAIPNRERVLSPPVTNGANGTLIIRRRFRNDTGAPVTRLRFRIVDISTFPTTGGIADMRALDSTDITISGINDSQTCLASNGVATTPCSVTVKGTTLEQPPIQTLGGGNNSTMTVTLGTPLPAGASVNIQVVLGVQQTGSFKFFFNVEALP